MFRALGARLTLDHKGVAGVALFEAAAQRMWIWANDGLKTANEYAPSSDGLKTATSLFVEGEFHENGRTVTALRCDSDNRSLCRVTLQRPDEWDPSTPLADHRATRYAPVTGSTSGFRLSRTCVISACRRRHLRRRSSRCSMISSKQAHTPGRSDSAPPLKRSSEASRSTRSSSRASLTPAVVFRSCSSAR